MTETKHNDKQDSNKVSTPLEKAPLFSLNFMDVKPDIITTVMGTDYLKDIINLYVSEEEREQYYHELKHMVNAIGDKDNIYKLTIPVRLKQELLSIKGIKHIDKRLGGDLSNFRYSALLYHMRRAYEYLKEDIKHKEERKIHTWTKLTPQKPDIYNNVGDEVQNYQYIMCKFYFNKYKKYMNRKNTSEEGWSYHLSIIYLLMITKMYQLLRKKIIDVEDFIVKFFMSVNPIIVGFTYTIKYDVGGRNGFKILVELMQLNTNNQHLNIKPYYKVPALEIKYSLKNKSFVNTLDEGNTKTHFRGGDDERRNIGVLIKGYQNILELKVDIIGQEAIMDLTGYGEDGGCIAVDKSLFSFITDRVMFEVITYKILSGVLSQTKEHYALKELAIKRAEEKYKQGNLKAACENSKESLINLVVDRLVFKDVYKDLTAETLCELTENIINTFHLKREAIDKAFYAIILADKSDDEIREEIKRFGTKQQATIRKMVKYVRGNKKPTKATLLNGLYNWVSYRC